MPIKRRLAKRRDALSEEAEKWLRGEKCGFFQFKPIAELREVWDAYGDPNVATLDGAARMPVAVRSKR